MSEIPTIYENLATLCSLNGIGQWLWTVLGLSLDLVGLFVLILAAKNSSSYFKRLDLHTLEQEDMKIRIHQIDQLTLTNRSIMDNLDKRSNPDEISPLALGHPYSEDLRNLIIENAKLGAERGMLSAELGNKQYHQSISRKRLSEADFHDLQLAAVLISFGLVFQIVGAIPC